MASRGHCPSVLSRTRLAESAVGSASRHTARFAFIAPPLSRPRETLARGVGYGCDRAVFPPYRLMPEHTDEISVKSWGAPSEAIEALAMTVACAPTPSRTPSVEHPQMTAPGFSIGDDGIEIA